MRIFVFGLKLLETVEGHSLERDMNRFVNKGHFGYSMDDPADAESGLEGLGDSCPQYIPSP